MLKRDLLVTLHLHVRVFASAEVKRKCREDMERERAERVVKWSGKNARFQPPIRHTRQEKDDGDGRGRRNGGLPLTEEPIEDEEDEDAYEKIPGQLEEEAEDGDEDPDFVKPSSFEGSPNWFSLSPREARRRTRRLPSTSSSRALSSEYEGPYMSRRRSSARDHLGSTSRGRGRVLEDVISENPFYESGEEDDGEDDVEGDDIEDDEDSEDEDDPNVPSVIPDPGRATPKERRWLTKMSEGKSPWIVKRFETQVSPGVPAVHFLTLCFSIHQYFDGKCTDDEILYHADISRKQLREVLHHYDEYVSLSFHSSISNFPFRVTPRATLFRPSPVHRSLPASESRLRDPIRQKPYKGARASIPLTSDPIALPRPLGLGSSILLPPHAALCRKHDFHIRIAAFELQLPSVPSSFTVTSWALAALALLLVRLRV